MHDFGKWTLLVLALLCSPFGCSRAPDVVGQAALEEYTPQPKAIAQDAVQAGRGDQYDSIVENDFVLVARNPLSTFSVDVDTASYANVRRFLHDRTRPPQNAVRIEELVNYFRYDYPIPNAGGAPFAVDMEVVECPWQTENRLVRIGVQGKVLETEARPPANLVFLLDVSGSMHGPDRLPLLKQAMYQLLEQLNQNDRVALVVYAGASGLVLPSTPVVNRAKIAAAIERLRAGGSTNGGEGIKLAYEVARENFIQGGVNRVFLATDGDFNVGVTSQGSLVDLLAEEAKSNIFLTVLGFGRGNLNDAMMEQISNRGNGAYAYIDSAREARRVLATHCQGTLVTIAKDVKIQVEFNPTCAESYRLIGYENRLMASHEFDDDRKDAGDVGAGHQVTAIYEVVPSAGPRESSETLVFQSSRELSERATGDELLCLKLRFKEPENEKSELLSFSCSNQVVPFTKATKSTQFAVAVAEFGMLLRGSRYGIRINYQQVAKHARSGASVDPLGDRAEFQELVRLAARYAPLQPGRN